MLFESGYESGNPSSVVLHPCEHILLYRVVNRAWGEYL